MKKQTLLAASLVVAGMIAGCGGGGSDAPSATVAGKVADGYLENATVFLDKNGNYRLDAGEPSTTTDANGAYSLAVDPADVGQYPIVALALAGITYDRTDVSATDPIAHSYLLSLPKESVTGTVASNFISPMSTQLREMMETGTYDTMQAAMDELRTSLGLPVGINMMGDYIATPYPAMHTAAQNMAAVMGEQAPMLFRNYSGSTAIDVNRYRGMMGTIFGNMSTVRAATQQSTMTQFMNTMSASLGDITAGAPFRNMSSYYRGGMTGGAPMGGSMMNR